jgi:hypothetical protein
MWQMDPKIGDRVKSVLKYSPTMLLHTDENSTNASFTSGQEQRSLRQASELKIGMPYSVTINANIMIDFVTRLVSNISYLIPINK